VAPPRRYVSRMTTRDEQSELERDEPSDASVRGDNDPPTRGRPLKALERETELEFQRAEAHNTGGAEHKTRDESTTGKPE